MSDWTTWDFVTWGCCFALSSVATHFRLRHHNKQKEKFHLRPLEVHLELIDWAIGRFIFRLGRDLFAILSLMGLIAWAWYAIFPPG